MNLTHLPSLRGARRATRQSIFYILYSKFYKGMVKHLKRWTLLRRLTFTVTIFYHAFLLLMVYVLQDTVFPYLKLFGLVPLLLPIAGTGVAVYQGRIAGGIAGIFAGILCDITFNQPVGLFTVLLTFSGILVGVLADTVIARGFATYLISCIAVLALSAFIQMFPLLFFERVTAMPLLIVAFRQTVYSLIYAIPIWFFVRALGKRAQRAAITGRPM